MSNVTLVTTVIAAAASYDLTAAQAAYDELKITGPDTWTQGAITQVSRSVMRETNRVFAPEYVQDLFDIRRRRYQRPIGFEPLQLSRWPVLAITSIVVNQADLTTLTLVENTDFRVDYAKGEVYRLNSDTGTVTTWEALPVTARYSGGYGAAVKETHSVPASPYAVTVTQAVNFSCDQTVAYGSGILLTPVASSPTVGQYTVVPATGVYTFNAADLAQALAFAYCTETIPDDLKEAALRLVTARYRARSRDPALIQRDTPGVGSERFWFGGAPGQKGPFPPDIEGLLDGYRTPVAG